MKCPSCGKLPISLWSWFSGYNFARWDCDHCNVSLKANKGTWLVILLGVILFAGGAVLAFEVGFIQSIGQTVAQTIGEITGFTLTEKGVILLMMAHFLFLFGILSYFFPDGYKVNPASKN